MIQRYSDFMLTSKKLTKEEREEIKRMAPIFERPILIEGERPGETVLTAEGKIEKRVLPPVEEWEDIETETMTIQDKDEFYDYVTKCKNCGIKFIAFTEKYETVRNYCPGCGRKL